jgi:hypothetical protein
MERRKLKEGRRIIVSDLLEYLLFILEQLRLEASAPADWRQALLPCVPFD